MLVDSEFRSVYSEQVAPDRISVMVREGVCLFFENSTVCRFLLVPCLFCVFVFGLLVISAALIPFAGGCRFLLIHSMESLILAQDERWRRA